MNANLRRLLDLAMVANETGMVGFCPGERAILAGYVCIHCGRDPSIKGQTCGAPVNADGTLSKRIPKEVVDE